MRLRWVVLGLSSLSSSLPACKGGGAAPPPPPAPVRTASAAEVAPVKLRTERRPVEEQRFGVTLRDPFRWLENGEDPAVRAWAAGENQVARAYLAAQRDRDALAAQLKPLIYVDSVSVPTKAGKRTFWERRAKDREKGVVYWREGDGEARVLLDPLAIDPSGKTSLGVVVPSDDGAKVAYALRENNADEATLYVMDVATQERSAIDVISGAKYATPAWTPDGRGFYYTWLPVDPAIPVADRPGFAEVRFHRLGTDPKTDVVIRERTNDPSTFLFSDLSEDGRFLFLTVWRGWSANDLYVRTMDVPSAPERDGPGKKRGFVPLAVGKANRYSAAAYKGRFYVTTDEGAPRLRVFTVDPAKLEREKWRELIPEDPEAVLTSLDVIGGRLALAYNVRATTQLRIHELDGRRVRDVPLPTLGTASPLSGRDDDDEAFFSFSSFTYPPEVYSTRIKSGETKLHDRVQVPIDPARYVVEQVRYPSKDGVEVSMFLVHAKDFAKNGDAPTLLWGYGGFNVSLTPTFRASLFPWLDRGGLFALPNLRGGGEYGESWHQAGMRERKQNVFDDFIAAAEWLVKEGYTRTPRLGISGRSNGGLLVGAAVTQRPDLFGAVLCGVPLLDMLRFHLFGSGKTWMPEYGDPDKEAEFRWLSAYSPYQRITAGTRYPPLLMLSADHDDRVDPMHARKFVAALADASSGPGPYLLRVEANAGHGGADLRQATVEQAADELAFLIENLGVR